jgi:hypothetical protein
LNDPYAIWWRVAAGGVDLREIAATTSVCSKSRKSAFWDRAGDCLAQSVNEGSLAVASTKLT